METLPYGGLIESILVTLVMVSAVLATGGKRWTLAVAVVLVTPALAGKWLNYLAPGLVPAPVFLVATALFLAFIVGQLILFILRTPRVDANVLCAGLAGYLMLGLLWVPAYVLIADLTPGAIVAQTGISGSAELGDFVVLGGQSGSVGHIKIGAGAHIAGAAHAKDDVPPGARMAGTPAKR